DAGASFPRGSELGVRWGHIGKGFETSVSLFDGFNHLPNVDSTLAASGREIGIRRVYPAIRTFGADAAVPLRWLTLKGEAAYFTSSSPQTDEYVLYVVQVERQAGEWLWVAGYVGEAVTA